MHPVQHFRANFAQGDLTETKPDHPLDDQVGNIEWHDTDSQVRNLCFVWADGRRAFFNYAYLICGDFKTSSETNLIQLNFSSSTVSLHGYGLETLFIALEDHLPRLIRATDPRYIVEKYGRETIVIAIHIEKGDGS